MMSDEIRVKWTGQTRDAVQSNLIAMLEMGDVSRETVDAFQQDSSHVVFPDADAARQAVEEMEYIAGMGHPDIHEPTLETKTAAIREELDG